MLPANAARIARVTAAALLLLGAAGASAGARAMDANPMLHVAEGSLADGSGRPVSLRCVNLSPWLDPEPYLVGRALRALARSPSEMQERLQALVGPAQARTFWQQWQDAFVTEADFRHLAEQGFTCVRLPLNFRSLVAGFEHGAVTLDASGIAPVDRAVQWAARDGLYVILDLHAAPGGQNAVATVADVPSSDRTARLWVGPSAAANQAQTAALWHALAARYAQARGVGGYDLLNEPAVPAGAPSTALADLDRLLIASIRSVDAAHLLVIEGNSFAHDFSTLRDLPDANLLYEFHEYAALNPAWRTPHQQALAPYLALRAATHRPLWLGEFGENSATWQRQIVALMAANGVGWAVWPWKRIDLHNAHPVIQTIRMPESWNRLSRYLDDAVLARRPSRAQALQAMADMLQAIRSANCAEDSALAAVLAGR